MAGVLAAGWTPLLAQEGVVLVPENPTPESHISRTVGAVEHEESTTTMKDVALNITPPGAPESMSGTMNGSQSTAEEWTSLGEGNYRGTVRGSEQNQVAVAGQQMPAETKENPLEGQDILLTWDGTAYAATFADDSVTPTPEQQAKLDELATEYTGKHKDNPWEIDQLLYGTGPRAVGDSWDLDAEALNGLMGGQSDESFEMSEGKVTLRELTEVDGVPHAILDVEFNVSGRPPTGEGQEGEGRMTMAVTGTVTRNLEQFYDAAVDLTMEGTIEFTSTDPSGMKIEMSGPLSMSGSITHEPAAATEGAEAVAVPDKSGAAVN